MAARINPFHDAATRQRIQTSQLINRLTGLALGKIDMPPHAVTAALGLLKKAVPDLQAVQLSGDDQAPVVVSGFETLSTATLREIAGLGLSAKASEDA